MLRFEVRRPRSEVRLSYRGCDKPLALTFEHAIFLFIAGTLGGALNAVAGGGSFVAFPALLFVGVPPIPANATNSLALWTGVTASGGAYRNRLDVPMRVLLPLLIAGLVGGIIGAFCCSALRRTLSCACCPG